MRQLTGITLKTKTNFEKEVDRLRIMGSLYPRSGDQKIDRWTLETMGEHMGRIGEQLISNPAYQAMDDLGKEELIKRYASKIKTMAKNDAIMLHSKELLNDDYEKLKGLSKQSKIRGIQRLKRNGVLPDYLFIALLEKLK